MSAIHDASLLREVSRSFYLSVRILPKEMRSPVALGYLLARASDTLADTADATPEERIVWLNGFATEMEGGDSGWRSNLQDFSRRQSHSGERLLMSRLDDVFGDLDELPFRQREIVADVIRIIISGQHKDVERSMQGSFVLETDAQLEDYCHRVAGCVGVFWTRIGFETLGGKFSGAEALALEEQGERFGRGLQLVNILRDLPD